MRQMTSPLILALCVATPALAQQPPTRVPAAPVVQADVQTPPTAARPARPAQPATLPQAATPPRQATAPRADSPRSPFLGSAIKPVSPATNIRLVLTITDTHTGAPVTKAVSLLVLTGNSGMIRTTSYGKETSVLNVDALASAYENGLISVRMTFEYTPDPITEGPNAGRSPRLNESITVVLQDGTPMLVSQSADPVTDRKVTTELTATIVK